MKKIIYILLCVFLFAACSEEDGTIIGTTKVEGSGVEAQMANITVKLYDSPTSVYKTTTTDANGDFIFSGLESGNYFVAATVVINGDTYDTGNVQYQVYVGGDIERPVSLTLTKRN
ncbi:carboxypeptidase regulatory-like domain-containing protein [Maribellus sp. CM-23]|uniref:SdrD B-like domain-containing protein n=1 Tax=Maribellus sp. CM-23 TaxID=2781026 RepID=UPI001F346DAE|nr:SdrD B-like domain-containing protein [Maribellus sp. CM-23]MCE4564542.1 carboxypeptidase regulatory-like domain-containing protein [Maribellus sp. CM-23]